MKQVYVIVLTSRNHPQMVEFGWPDADAGAACDPCKVPLRYRPIWIEDGFFGGAE